MTDARDAQNPVPRSCSRLVDRIQPIAGGASLLVLDASDTPLDRLPFESGSVTSIAVQALERVPPERTSAALCELDRVASRYVFAQVSAHRDLSSPRTARSRQWWEDKFFDAGFGRHPLYQQLTPYVALEHEGSDLLLAFERLPGQGRARFTRDVLRVERDLHMDMLRESGRRADAHVVRYMLASQLVQRGDRVIDAACGLGYGSALINDGGLAESILAIDTSLFAIEYGTAIFGSQRPRLEFLQDDVHGIARLPGASADVIVSFETLEHIGDPRAFVAEAQRVLRPGGRFICSVPNQWIDETGRDPNPYHLHVFDLPALLQLFPAGLRVQKVIGQTAGGGMKHHGGTRTLVHVESAATAVDPEWWLVVATADGPA